MPLFIASVVTVQLVERVPVEELTALLVVVIVMVVQMVLFVTIL